MNIITNSGMYLLITDANSDTHYVHNSRISIMVRGDNIGLIKDGFEFFSSHYNNINSYSSLSSAITALQTLLYSGINYSGDFFHGASDGVVEGLTADTKFGYNGLVGNSDTLISGVGGSAPYQPTAAVTVECISSSGNDTSNGSGARQITIVGINGSGILTTETITTNGTNASTATTSSFLRVFRAFVSSVGTFAGSNAGTITIRASGGGTSFCNIETGQGQTKHTHLTVPANKKMFLYDVHIACEAAKNTNITIWQLPNINDVASPYSGAKRAVARYPLITGTQDFDYKNAPKIFNAWTDVWATGVIGTGTAQVSVEFTYLFKDI